MAGGLMIAIGPKKSKGMKRESDEDMSEMEEPDAGEVSAEQRDAGAMLVDAVKKGDSEATYLAVCNIVALHQESEESEDYLARSAHARRCHAKSDLEVRAPKGGHGRYPFRHVCYG